MSGAQAIDEPVSGAPCPTYPTKLFDLGKIDADELMLKKVYGSFISRQNVEIDIEGMERYMKTYDQGMKGTYTMAHDPQSGSSKIVH